MQFQKGHQSPAKWLPGQSGNPSGKPKEQAELERLARSHAPDAVKRIVEIMDGRAFTYTRRGLKLPVPVPPATQLAAAVVLLERGFGKPVQPLASDKNSPVTLQKIERVIVQLNGDDEALRILNAEPVTNGHNGYEQ